MTQLQKALQNHRLARSGMEAVLVLDARIARSVEFNSSVAALDFVYRENGKLRGLPGEWHVVSAD